MIDRLSIRMRPSGWPIMYQTWGRLLFMHWSIAVELLRPVLAPQLNIDTFEGRAWTGITPLTLRGIRPILLPSLPVLSTSHELNVRTYVHVGGVPGGLVPLPGSLQCTCRLAGSLALWSAIFPGPYAA
jgi:hypothetical protein